MKESIEKGLQAQMERIKNKPICDPITGETINSKRIESNKIAVSMRLNKSIIEKVDGVADEMGLTRTGAISCILAMYFNSQESIKVLNNISNLIRKEENVENV